MPLRLAGEEYSIVQGLDNLGRLRSITVSDASPGLKLDQQGSGALLDLRQAGAARLALTNGGRLDLPVAGSGAGLLLGGDAALYRQAAGVLASDGDLRVTNLRTWAGGVYTLRDSGGSDRTVLSLAGGDTLTLANPIASRALAFETGGARRAEFDALTGDLSLGGQKLQFGTFGAEDTNLYRAGSNWLKTDDNFEVGGSLFMGSGFQELSEIADAAAPSADKARLYVRDNGAGKTQLAVAFPTGAIQVLATEP